MIKKPKRLLSLKDFSHDKGSSKFIFRIFKIRGTNIMLKKINNKGFIIIADKETTQKI